MTVWNFSSPWKKIIRANLCSVKHPCKHFCLPSHFTHTSLFYSQLVPCAFVAHHRFPNSLGLYTCNIRNRKAMNSLANHWLLKQQYSVFLNRCKSALHMLNELSNLPLHVKCTIYFLNVHTYLCKNSSKYTHYESYFYKSLMMLPTMLPFWDTNYETPFFMVVVTRHGQFVM